MHFKEFPSFKSRPHRAIYRKACEGWPRKVTMGTESGIVLGYDRQLCVSREGVSSCCDEYFAE